MLLSDAGRAEANRLDPLSFRRPAKSNQMGLSITWRSRIIQSLDVDLHALIHPRGYISLFAISAAIARKSFLEQSTKHH